jgi:hypothetical protein
MSPPRFGLDSSLKDRIASPSPLFREFVRHFFTEPNIWIRRESDVTLVDRLEGDERATAIEMIATNVRTGREHIISAAAYLKIASVVPTLEAMLARETNGFARYTLGIALHTLGALDDDRLFDIMQNVMKDGAWNETLDVLNASYRIFRPDVARKLIAIGLNRPYHMIRFSALDALIAVSYIEHHGGHFTMELWQKIFDAAMAASTVGSGVPRRFDEMQYFLGEDVWLDPDLFASRLKELDAKYAPPA